MDDENVYSGDPEQDVALSEEELPIEDESPAAQAPAEEEAPAEAEIAAQAEEAVSDEAPGEAAAQTGYDESNPKKWFIIHTYSGFEQKVKESLVSRSQA